MSLMGFRTAKRRNVKLLRKEQQNKIMRRITHANTHVSSTRTHTLISDTALQVFIYLFLYPFGIKVEISPTAFLIVLKQRKCSVSHKRIYKSRHEAGAYNNYNGTK